MNTEQSEVDELAEIEAQLRALTIRVIRLRADRHRVANEQRTHNEPIPPHRALRIGDRVRFRLQGTIYTTGHIERITPAYVHIRTPGQPALIRRAPQNVTFIPDNV
jgi:hypothetical protein